MFAAANVPTEVWDAIGFMVEKFVVGVSRLWSNVTPEVTEMPLVVKLLLLPEVS
jgi:hypothetical protein